MFSDLVDMIDHKKNYCKLRFTCKCDMTNEAGGVNGTGEPCLNGSVCGGGKSISDEPQGGEGEQGCQVFYF